MWHLKNIPKVMHFYWGNETISYLRYLSIHSFSLLNPDWKIKLHVPETFGLNKCQWESSHQKNSNIVKDYYFLLLNNPKIDIVKYDFSKSFDNDAHEVHKSDFLRWKILSAEGGCWSDMDILYKEPINNILENNPDNSEAQIAVCIYKNRAKHAIGFLMSSPNNLFFKTISEIAETVYDPASYQSIGSAILNNNYRNGGKIRKVFGKKYCILLEDKCVYVFNDKLIEQLFSNYSKNLDDFINDSSIIGFHWYGGSPISQNFENIFTDESIEDFDNILTRILKKLRADYESK